MRFLLIGSIFLLTLSACDKGVLSSATWTMENQQWIASDHNSFLLEAVDTITVYTMEIELNHDAKYPYQNLYIKTTTTFPSGKEVASVTSIELLKKDGSWAGDCSGKSCTLSLPLQQRFTFPEIGSYSWSVEPYMRKDTVEGLNSFKVVCRKATSINK
jgi:gliding motility-associated lipoprotein GldH